MYKDMYVFMYLDMYIFVEYKPKTEIIARRNCGIFFTGFRNVGYHFIVMNVFPLELFVENYFFFSLSFSSFLYFITIWLPLFLSQDCTIFLLQWISLQMHWNILVVIINKSGWLTLTILFAIAFFFLPLPLFLVS